MDPQGNMNNPQMNNPQVGGQPMGGQQYGQPMGGQQFGGQPMGGPQYGQPMGGQQYRPQPNPVVTNCIQGFLGLLTSPADAIRNLMSLVYMPLYHSCLYLFHLRL